MTEASPSAPTVRDPAFLRAIFWMGIIEGTSTLLLFFVAMPLKYYAGMPRAVTIVGGLHGILFLLYGGMLLMGRGRVPLSPKLFVWGMVGAVVPFGPFFVDVPIARMLAASRSDAGALDAVR